MLGDDPFDLLIGRIPGQRLAGDQFSANSEPGPVLDKEAKQSTIGS
jgi:hypothetical protein